MSWRKSILCVKINYLLTFFLFLIFLCYVPTWDSWDAIGQFGATNLQFDLLREQSLSLRDYQTQIRKKWIRDTIIIGILIEFYCNTFIGFAYLKLTVTSQIDREIVYISTQMDLSFGKYPNTHFYLKQQHTIQNSIVIYKHAI